MRKLYLAFALTMVMMFAVATGVMAQTQPCGTTTWTLWAGQTINVGTVTVENDDTNLYITYAIDTNQFPNAEFGILQVWVGNDWNLLPAANGNPIPGHFPFQSGKFPFDPSVGLTTYTFTIPFSSINVTGLPTPTSCTEMDLYVVTHAEVYLDGYSEDGESETAYGGNQDGPTGNKWWYYGVYTICCDFGGGGMCFAETAYAKGTHVWTTDKKSNPEKLPSLNLTKNRWGWAINLTEAGTTTYDIWAGAGLNKTANGTLVGSLTVYWDGSNATITYNMYEGYYLQEVHIYASDDKPTTTAPGQYGYPTEGYNVNNLSTFSYEVSLSDSNDDGVWIIGHAIVSNGQCE